MQDCNHEDPGTRTFVHACRAAAWFGAQKVLIRTVDKDVVVIAITEYSNLCLIRPDVREWIAFGTGNHFQYISTDIICEALGPRKAKALPLFHAITGCDTTSSFHGKGKTSAWNVWNALDADSSSNLLLSFKTKTGSASKLNATKRGLFTRKGRPLEIIPSTQVNST